jgi:hypothetical protein
MHFSNGKGAWLAIAMLILLPAVLLAQMPVYRTPAEIPPGLGGEYAMPKPKTGAPPGSWSPEPTVVWGGTTGLQLPNLRGLSWGLYGLDYDAWRSRMQAVYFWHDNIKFYRSIDSASAAMPETIFTTQVPGPVRDSFQDFASCRYDDCIWIHSSKQKMVYKVDKNGVIKRSFNSPAIYYPTGIAFDERNKELYLIDRMGEGVYPCSMYVTDTLGTVRRRHGLSNLGYSYAGARCIDMDESNTNPNWPSILLVYSYFSGSGVLDSCGLFELDRNTMAILHRWNMPYTSIWGNMRGVGYDPRTGDYWVGSMQNPDNSVWKVDGAYTPVQTSPDAGVMTIQWPRGQINIGASGQPRAIIRNFENATRTIPVRMKIGSGYNMTLNKTLLANTEDTVNFPLWTASVPGRFEVRCTTELSGDIFAQNNVFIESIDVSGHDVGATKVVAPTGMVNGGDVITPACSVYNYGTAAENYAVNIRIGAWTAQSPVFAHQPGTYQYVTFADWTAAPGGLQAVGCSTTLSTDVNLPNNAAFDTVLVRLSHDVGTQNLLAPVGNYDSGAVVVPACTVFNYGMNTETYNVRMKLGSFYNQAINIPSHAAGAALYVTFPECTLNIMGTHAVTCTTELTGDMANANDAIHDSVIVRLLDVAVLRIDEPTGTKAPGSGVLPIAVLKNYGNTTVSATARFIIPASAYSDDQPVNNLAPGEERSVSFTSWTASPNGLLATRCTVIVAGDLFPENNEVDSFVVVGNDVQTVAILAPLGSVDSAGTFLPQATVRNNGLTAVDLNVKFDISDGYTNTFSITGLPSGAESTVTFASWTPLTRGVLTTKCSTDYSGDVYPGNDKLEDSVTVIAHDVGATAILVPAGIVDTLPKTPQATVTNFGNGPETFDVAFFIYDSVGTEIYNNTQNVAGLAGGTSVPVSFASWGGHHEVGNYSAKCSTMLVDNVPANDVVTNSFVVSAILVDVGVTAIAAPTGNVDTLWATVQADVKNFGEATQTFDAIFWIYDNLSNVVYCDTATASAVAPGATVTLPFADWTGVHALGQYVARCSTTLGDFDPLNDAVSDTFNVVENVTQIDVGATAIVAPVGIKNPNYDTVMATVRNYGTEAATFTVRYRIFDAGSAVVYNQTAIATALGPGASVTLTFPSWGGTPHATGTYTARCSTEASGDPNPGNDAVSRGFTVLSNPLPSGWHRMADVPFGGKNKGVKDGGALAYAVENDTESYIYAFKGNGRCEFYKYNIATNTWASKESIPAIGSSGKKKPVKKGGTLNQGNDGNIYATKGNNTLEWWQYDPRKSGGPSYPWVQKTDVPSGAKGVGGGGSACAVELNDTTYVYLLRGNGTFDFYRYNVGTGTWTSMATAPSGTSGKSFKAGSCIGYNDYIGRIFALKATYNELFAYAVDSFGGAGTWTNKTMLPFTGSMGKKKKVKDGAGIAYSKDDDLMYALKGNNTQEFWAYKADSDRWTQKEDMPIGGGKRPKGGGTLIRGDVKGQGVLWALKGNNTFEFYQYVPPITVSSLGSDLGQVLTGSTTRLNGYEITIAPNPFSSATCIRYALPTAGNASLKLYDVTGKLVSVLATGNHNAGVSSIRLEGATLPSGIYMLKLATDVRTTTTKLIVQ